MFQSIVLQNLNAKFLCQSVAFFIACKPGWIGPNCIAMCPYPTYGHKCIYKSVRVHTEWVWRVWGMHSKLVFIFCKISAHFKDTFFYCIFLQYSQQMQTSLEQRIKDCLYKYQRSCTKFNQAPNWMTYMYPTNKTTITPSMTNH